MKTKRNKRKEVKEKKRKKAAAVILCSVMAAAAIKKIMETITFIEFWQLLRPSETFDTRGRFESCLAKWNRWDEAKRTRVAQQIATKQQKGEFVHPNPYFAMDDAAQQDEIQQARSKPRTETLSYNEYYARYGTTEEKDGWQMANPTGQKVIYVKH